MGDLELGEVVHQFCDAAFTSVVENLLQGYVLIGGTATGQAGHLALQGGVDFVWDLWNEQFCAFTYPAHGFNTDSLIGAAGNVHLGFGTGRFDNVHDAWSGEFRSVEYGVELKAWRALGLNGAVQYFQSPDGAMKGGLGSVGGSVSIPSSVSKLFKLPANASVSVGRGIWTPSNQLTESVAPRSKTAQRKSTAKGYYYDVQEGVLGVGSHMLQVMGYSPGPLLLAGYSTAVAMAKEHAEAKGIRDRAAAFKDLRLTLCSAAYRSISQYKADVPSGTSQTSYDEQQVQRTKRGNFIITSTVKTATGEWRTTRRLHTPDAKLLDQYTYWMAIGGAPNGFINRRSYPLSKFSDEIERRYQGFINR